MGFESSGFEECSSDVVGEVSQVLGRSRVGVRGGALMASVGPLLVWGLSK